MIPLYIVLKADPQIGTGHLIRNLNLARELNSFDITFALPQISNNVKELIKDFNSIEIGSFENFPQILKSAPKNSLVLVDCYSLDANFERLCRSYCKAILVIDDLANRTHDCDLLIDGNLDSKPSRYEKLVPTNCRIITGEKYALIRSVFALCKKSSVPSQFSKGFICFGGADPAHGVLLTVTSIIQSEFLKKFQYTVVTGAINPDYDEIVAITQQYPSIFQVYRHTDKIPEILKSHDFSIGAAGGMCLERICIGIPTIAIAIADNQEGFKAVSEAHNLGLTMTVEELKNPLKLEEQMKVLQDNGLTYMQNCQNLVDGKGIIRVANEIERIRKKLL